LTKGKSGPILQSEATTVPQRRKTVTDAGNLTDREYYVFYCRLPSGYNGGKAALKDIGSVLGVTGERVRQIEYKAIRKIRRIANRYADHQVKRGRKNGPTSRL
jgi:DNA-directed RNA polymerase sigma subunit (sigma70/sigma32)